MTFRSSSALRSQGLTNRIHRPLSVSPFLRVRSSSVTSRLGLALRHQGSRRGAGLAGSRTDPTIFGVPPLPRASCLGQPLRGRDTSSGRQRRQRARPRMRSGESPQRQRLRRLHGRGVSCPRLAGGPGEKFCGACGAGLGGTPITSDPTTDERPPLPLRPAIGAPGHGARRSGALAP